MTLQLSQTLQQQFEAGKQQLLAQDYQQAVVQFSALANAEPGFAGIWYNLALAQWRSGQIDAAQASLQQAVKVAPTHIDSHNLLGVLARQRGQLALAKQHGVEIGAHPSYPDLQGFGRRSMALSHSIFSQCGMCQAGATL